MRTLTIALAVYGGFSAACSIGLAVAIAASAVRQRRAEERMRGTVRGIAAAGGLDFCDALDCPCHATRSYSPAGMRTLRLCDSHYELAEAFRPDEETAA